MSRDKRISQRYYAYLDVRMGSSTLLLNTTNISLSGLQLSCSRMQGDMLMTLPELKAETVDIKLSLNAEIVCTIQCGISYFSPYDESEYLIGVEFLKFIDNSHELLSAFITENEGRSLRPVK